MRLIHTADWHLGRLFHNVHLTRDQEHVLLQLVELVAEVRPDAVLVAGDLYDRAVPPTEAVGLLDHILTELILGQGVPVIAIAGNHDSAVRVGFASTLLRERGLHVAGELPQAARPSCSSTSTGRSRARASVRRAAVARFAYGDDDIHDQQAVAEAGAAGARGHPPRRALRGRGPRVRRRFTGVRERASAERGRRHPVAASAYEGFDYVALGHLHRPQRCGGETVSLRGIAAQVLLRRARPRKSVSVVDIGAPGNAGEARARPRSP